VKKGLKTLVFQFSNLCKIILNFVGIIHMSKTNVEVIGGSMLCKWEHVLV
jgi:hypothetical protein